MLVQNFAISQFCTGKNVDVNTFIIIIATKRGSIDCSRLAQNSGVKLFHSFPCFNCNPMLKVDL